VRYQLLVTRAQIAERTVSAVDEEAARQKVQADIEKPYGCLASWKTEGYEDEVLNAESRVAEVAVDVSDGPMLFQ
jgi:hypothetical protein